MPLGSDKREAAAAACTSQWLKDLQTLLNEAATRFADVVWTDPDGNDRLYGHKAILYARSPGNFVARFLQQCGHSTAPPTTHSAASSFDRWSARTLDSPASLASSASSTPTLGTFAKPPIATSISLGVADRAVLTSLLSYLYTGEGAPDALLNFLFEEQLPAAQELPPVERLRQDLLFMWRSKLYADMQLQITFDDVDAPNEPEAIFTVHRMMLLRSPYFRNLLLSSYADSSNRLLMLPSPPFSAAALHFTLGYLYCGTLDFSNRTFDLTTALSIWRCAAYLNLDLLQNQVECAIADLATGHLQRWARVFEWSLSPDVNSPNLSEAARSVLLRQFGLAWRKEVGLLGQDVQQDLVHAVCKSIDPNTAIATLRELLSARTAVQTSLDPWAQHIKAMLEPIEVRLIQVIGSQAPSVLVSSDFVALLEGRTFSIDILEASLATLMSGMSESSAPQTYEAIVQNVLLRDGGLQMDARARVEECRAKIAMFIAKRWLSIKEAGQKELADEIGVSPVELLNPDASTALPPKVKPTTTPKPAPISTIGRGRPKIEASAFPPGSATTKPRLRDTSRAPTTAKELLPAFPSRARLPSSTSATNTRLVARRRPSNLTSTTLASKSSSSSLKSVSASQPSTARALRPKTPIGALPTVPKGTRKPLSHASALPNTTKTGEKTEKIASPLRARRKLSSASARSETSRQPLGTRLNVGIKCVVSFANGQKAVGDVYYIGPAQPLGSGNFVGVEIDDIGDLGADIARSSGTIDGIRYFGGSGESGQQACGVFVRAKQVMYLL